MPQSLVVMLAHVVFSTKIRLPMITADVEEPLFEYIGGILRNLGCGLIQIGGEKDHVHILVSVAKTLSIAELLNKVKTGSSKWMHRVKGRRKFGWQVGYAAFSVSEDEVPRIREYIRNQKHHHRKLGFKEELRALLRQPNLEFDEEYLWD